MTTGPSSPQFPEGNETVGAAINTLLGGLRSRLIHPPSLAIATAYFNPGGFALLAEELEQVGGVRLLLGAEPDQEQPQTRPLGSSTKRRRRRNRSGPAPEVRRALEGHQRSLHQDRDLVGFTRATDAQERRLVAWLREHPNVQVRRYEQGFLHGKAFIVESDKTGLIAGSSNFTYAGLARNNELNLGHYQPRGRSSTELVRPAVGSRMTWRFVRARWQPHQPWHVFLRMLHELYGADLEEAAQEDTRLGLTRFQVDGVWRAKRIPQRRRGVLIVDEVGLGKTFLARPSTRPCSSGARKSWPRACNLEDATWKPLKEHNLAAVGVFP